MASTEYGIAVLFAKRAAIFAKCDAIQRNAPNFHGKSAAILGKVSSVWRTRRDKCGARYTVLISAAAARLLHSF